MAPSSYGKIWMTESSLFQLPQVVSGHAAKPHAKRRERRELKTKRRQRQHCHQWNACIERELKTENV